MMDISRLVREVEELKYGQEKLLGYIQNMDRAFAAMADEFDDDEGFNTFKTSFGERFAPFTDRVKALRPDLGDDFDLARDAYDTSKEWEGEDKEEFVKEALEKVENFIEKAKEAILGDGGTGEISVLEETPAGTPEWEKNLDEELAAMGAE